MPTELLRASLNVVPLPVIFVGADERIAVANPPAQALFGVSMIGRHYITALRQPNLLDSIEAAFAGRVPKPAQFLGTEAGRDTTYRIHVGRVEGEGIDGVLVSLEDVTLLQEAGQIRRDFIANVSHELKTPLTALLGFIETLRGAARDDAEARDRFLTIMEREAGRMNRLVRELLSLSRVEGEERIRPTEPVDVAALLHSTTLSLKPLAEEAGVRLEVIVPKEDEPPTVLGDADQLLQVFTNLVENAIKYGGSGGVVRLALSHSDNDATLLRPAVRVDVVDEGEGIDMVHIPRLTERFYRVDSHRSREMGGTGLGLAIVKHIVNRHRGRLRVTSARHVGSTFSVILPAA